MARHRVDEAMGLQQRMGLTCTACGVSSIVTDALTGLADRSAFRAALDSRVANEAAGEFAVLLIDLDRFKAVNDTLGHTAGDTLLTAVGRRLRGTLRGSDFAGRLGGDEFAVLIDAPASPEVVTDIATRIIELLSQAYLIDGRVATIGASVGVVLVEPEATLDAEMLLRQADLAMYQAKHEGRGRFIVFEPALQERAEAQRTLEMELRAALPLKQFELFYQPQVDLTHDRLTGFEALIRWRHPVRGLVPPDVFIPLAEEIGLITSIGEWVLREACQEATRWTGPYTVAVNVAAQQFDRGHLVAAVEAALRSSGLPSGRLELEVTETALLRSGGSTVAQLNALKTMGVQVSLDDFGTGYSSLTQLRSFAFDRVKIDRSFVDDVAVMRAVAALGRSLGMRVTAEGIETPQQMARLRADGYTEAQGYLLSRPVPATAVGQLIDKYENTARLEFSDDAGGRKHDHST